MDSLVWFYAWNTSRIAIPGFLHGETLAKLVG